ncbi:MAG: hypothetical protein VKJ02_15790 [Snowella sp.]|nr:hypothetical protein [Snowella sp.]
MTDSEQLVEIKGLIQHITTDLEAIRNDVENLKTETQRTNDRVEIYQRSSNQVVNLAFGLIVATTAVIIVPAILSR